jgi:hypothetical protein
MRWQAELPPVAAGARVPHRRPVAAARRPAPDPLMLDALQWLTDEQQAEIRELALAALAAYRDGGCVPAPAPTTPTCCR